MIRIEVDDPYGLTGSEYIDGLYVYFSKDPFTIDTLPIPYINNKTSYSGYSIDLPEKNTPYWIMWAYRGRDNQMTYSPIVSWIDWSDSASTLFNSRPGFNYGDAQFGQLASNLILSDRIDISKFGGTPGINWPAPIQTPVWVMEKGVINGATIGIEHFDIDVATLYKNGYLGKSGDMSDVLTPAMITELGGPVIQGRTVTTDRATFQAWVPTVTEFRNLLGPMFQCGIPTTKPAISVNVLQEDIWYLTSSEGNGGVFWLINSSGTLKPTGSNIKGTVKMLYSLELK